MNSKDKNSSGKFENIRFKCPGYLNVPLAEYVIIVLFSLSAIF